MQGKQKGVGLIEILVSLILLSIGFLSMSALQATSIRVSQQSNFRTAATHLAQNLGDTLRANPDSALNGDYVLALTTSAGAAVKDCFNNNCTSAELARYDLTRWRNSVINMSLLPSPAARVVSNADNSIYTITLMWDENRTGAAGTDCDNTDPDDKACLTLLVRI